MSFDGILFGREQVTLNEIVFSLKNEGFNLEIENKLGLPILENHFVTE